MGRENGEQRNNSQRDEGGGVTWRPEVNKDNCVMLNH